MSAYIARRILLMIPTLLGILFISFVVVQFTETARTPPKLICVPVSPTAKPVPVTVTVVPPAGGPVFGLTPVTVGVNVKVSVDVAGLVPSGVVTLKWTFAGIATAGETAVIEVAELTVKLVAFVEPNVTAVAPSKSTPLMFTSVPPSTGALLGDIAVTAGR